MQSKITFDTPAKFLDQRSPKVKYSPGSQMQMVFGKLDTFYNNEDGIMSKWR